jgi:hypothetical protein
MWSHIALVGDAFLGQLTTINRRGERSVLFENGMEVAGVDATGRGNVAFVHPSSLGRRRTTNRV